MIFVDFASVVQRLMVSKFCKKNFVELLSAWSLNRKKKFGNLGKTTLSIITFLLYFIIFFIF